MNKARCGHWHSGVLGLRQCKVEIFDRQRDRHARRAVTIIDDLSAIGLMDLAIEERTGKNFKCDAGV
jgi:hypothetical protein